MDLVELVRLLRAGASDRTLTRVLRHNRRTIAKYRSWAEQQGFLAGEVPTVAVLQRAHAASFPVLVPPQQQSSVAAYHEEIARYRAQGLEAAAIRVRLEEVHRHPVSYSAVWRLIRRLSAAGAPRDGAEPVVRVEVKPGSEAQVDFGYAGLCIDPRSGAVRKTWVFVMLLSFSRHLYAELVFDQRVATWLLCHQHAFAFFGGVPTRLVPDNLKAAVVRASFTEPEATRAYRECAEHYGFLIDPNPPRSPQLKGKVEQGGVHYVKRNYLAGRCTLESPPQSVESLNAGLRVWCLEVAGRRRHGTTKQQPLERFETVEQAALSPLPSTPYTPAIWRRVSVYRDCYVTFEGAYYSVPYRLVGHTLWLRGAARTVELYSEQHELVATHDRAVAPGERLTHLEHLPPEKIAGLTLTRQRCRAQAAAIGPATTALVELLLAHRPEDRLRSAGRLLLLTKHTSPAGLEHACARALVFGASDYPSVKRIVTSGLAERAEKAEPTAGPVLPTDQALHAPSRRAYTFMRHASEFVASLLGAASVGGVGNDGNEGQP
ncbi:MAG: IS21 family transposase [Nitrososphaerota archaeon]